MQLDESCRESHDSSGAFCEWLSHPKQLARAAGSIVKHPVRIVPRTDQMRILDPRLLKARPRVQLVSCSVFHVNSGGVSARLVIACRHHSDLRVRACNIAYPSVQPSIPDFYRVRVLKVRESLRNLRVMAKRLLTRRTQTEEERRQTVGPVLSRDCLRVNVLLMNCPSSQ